MGARIRAFDWASHPLGPPSGWPPTLRMAVSLCLNSSFPTAVYWGPDLHLLYNDAWMEIAADKHPWILGKPAREGWSDIWHVIGPQFEHVLSAGQGMALYDQMLPMLRGGAVRETWWNYSFTPIGEAGHGVVGVFSQGNEVTEVVRARRERQREVDRWREILRQAPAAVALLNGPRHVFEFANQTYLRLVGDRDIVGKTVAEALPEIAAQGFVGLLDGVYRSGEPCLGQGTAVKLQRVADGPIEDCVMDFIYQPLRGASGEIEGVFVLVTDVTDRARAEAALRLSNWQLGEERARLASVIEAEQRAQQALRRFNDALEGHVSQRTAELRRALEKQNEVADRLRASSQTDLIFQGLLDLDGTLRDANPVSLAAIRCALPDVVGRPFWDTPWFTATPGTREVVREAVAAGRRGQVVRTTLELQLPGGPRRFLFSLRPVFNARHDVVGLVPEALDLSQLERPPS
jgi:PAS domain-containing protein